MRGKAARVRAVTIGNNWTPTVARIAAVIVSVAFSFTTEKQMIKSNVAVAVLAALIGISGCASQSELVGAGTGAAVGAAVGGGPMASIGGAMVGFGAGHVYDQKHR